MNTSPDHLPLVNQELTLERNTEITITKRTFRFNKTVYQTQNITGFSEGSIKLARIPWIFIILAFCFSLVSFVIFDEFRILIDQLSFIFLTLLLFSIIGLLWNIIRPQYYGLIISLNSGEKTLFATRDKVNLRKVVDCLYKMMESEKDSTFKINITNSHVKGNLIQGDTRGNVSYESIR